MSRRDTILVAVLVNTALLALLFMMAINPADSRAISEEPAHVPIVAKPEPLPLPVVETALIDEVDRALESIVAKQEEEIVKEPEFVEVTVKRGDVLERIARANQTTVSALKKANHLKSERIEIGQVLRIPKKEVEELVATVQEQPEFYIIQRGDNPWTIAKQFHVRFNELLELNDLDEAKARNLKVGDRLRVH